MLIKTLRKFCSSSLLEEKTEGPLASGLTTVILCSNGGQEQLFSTVSSYASDEFHFFALKILKYGSKTGGI